MTDLSRRSFLRGALTLTAATVLSRSALASLEALAPLPTLYGDGVHDDTLAVQALLDGKAFRTADGFAGVAHDGLLHGVRLRLSAPLTIRKSGVTIQHCQLDFSEATLPSSGTVLFVEGDHTMFTHNHLFLPDRYFAPRPKIKAEEPFWVS